MNIVFGIHSDKYKKYTNEIIGEFPHTDSSMIPFAGNTMKQAGQKPKIGRN